MIMGKALVVTVYHRPFLKNEDTRQNKKQHIYISVNIRSIMGKKQSSSHQLNTIYFDTGPNLRMPNQIINDNFEC